jgi:hypothetical protein
MAASGPILLSIAISPNWSALAWTLVMYTVLELMAGNFIEPMLYGASTGMSSIAILIATIFWTVLWGFPGLLLSVPLTACLVVIGRQVPHLYFLEVLFGDETALPPEDRFYQRMLASNAPAARSLIEELLKTQSTEEVFDSVLVPAMSQVEDARHSEQMTGRRADEILQGLEELAEEIAPKAEILSEHKHEERKRVACVPARDFADEVACQLASLVITNRASVQVMSADFSTSDLLASLESSRPDAICIVGVPPHAMRHLRMRCQQIRTRFPDVDIVACILSKESDLSNLRSRIMTEHAQHVACSIQLLKEYLTSLLHPPTPLSESSLQISGDSSGAMESKKLVREIQNTEFLDGPEDGMFARLATNLARSFDAPIALITASDGHRRFWEAQCGLAEDILSATESEWDLSMCSKVVFADSSLVLTDTSDDECFANDKFLKERGVRFYAGAPLKTPAGEVIGSLCVLDTRPRQITDEQKEQLVSSASAVMTAIELHGAERPMEAVATDEVAKMLPA